MSTITVEGNTNAMPKESPAKDINHDNTNTTATSFKDSTSDSSSNQADEPGETEESSTSTEQWKKSKAQQRKSVCNTKKGIHFDSDLDNPVETIIQE
eukprot:12952241-Ditylum_brightwellii.AAC.1